MDEEKKETSYKKATSPLGNSNHFTSRFSWNIFMMIHFTYSKNLYTLISPVMGHMLPDKDTISLLWDYSQKCINWTLSRKKHQKTQTERHFTK